MELTEYLFGISEHCVLAVDDGGDESVFDAETIIEVLVAHHCVIDRVAFFFLDLLDELLCLCLVDVAGQDHIYFAARAADQTAAKDSDANVSECLEALCPVVCLNFACRL